MLQVKRGDVYYADMGVGVGSEQGGIRPVLVIQNDIGNRYSPTTIVAVITSQRSKRPLPTHISLLSGEAELPKNSTVLLEQVRTIDKKRLKGRMGNLSCVSMEKIDNATQCSLGLSYININRPSSTMASV